MRPIGGFMPLAIDDLPAAPITPWQRWTGGARTALTFHNARSALIWLLRQKSISRLWLPAYICPELFDAARDAGVEAAFYPVGETLAPDVPALDAALRRGDAALGVDYFGSSPAAPFLALVKAREDVLWIEDRAQAWDPGVDAWGTWLLYSPRKLLGVPDGGLLVSYRETLTSPDRPAPDVLAFMAPALERFEDAEETNHEVWYARFRAVEAGAHVSPETMSRLAQGVLRRVDAAAIAHKRRRNGALLAKTFAAIALYPFEGHSAAVPFGVPIRVADAAAVAARLAERGLFCARHWLTLPCDASAFPAEHRLAHTLLTLPCDQRYGEAEMQRLITGVAAILL